MTVISTPLEQKTLDYVLVSLGRARKLIVVWEQALPGKALDQTQAPKACLKKLFKELC